MNVIREDGRIEWTCEHGIGHTIVVPAKYQDEDSWWVHGCDGCCSSEECQTEKNDMLELMSHV